MMEMQNIISTKAVFTKNEMIEAEKENGQIRDAILERLQ